MAYKAICFDHGGVLVGQPSSEPNKKASELLGVDQETYNDAYFRYNKQPNRGEITWHELIKLVVDDLGKPEKYGAFVKLWDENSKNRSVNKAVLDLVDRLRAQGYKVAILSNNTADVLGEIQSQGLDNHFDVVHISALTGFVKPEPEAFTHLAEALQVAVDELVFIDDSPKSLSTADQCGYTPILFHDYAQLVQKLAKLGIKA